MLRTVKNACEQLIVLLSGLTAIGSNIWLGGGFLARICECRCKIDVSVSDVDEMTRKSKEGLSKCGDSMSQPKSHVRMVAKRSKRIGRLQD